VKAHHDQFCVSFSVHRDGEDIDLAIYGHPHWGGLARVCIDGGDCPLWTGKLTEDEYHRAEMSICEAYCHAEDERLEAWRDDLANHLYESWRDGE
jgi:hypothetical protein